MTHSTFPRLFKIACYMLIFSLSYLSIEAVADVIFDDTSYRSDASRLPLPAIFENIRAIVFIVCLPLIILTFLLALFKKIKWIWVILSIALLILIVLGGSVIDDAPQQGGAQDEYESIYDLWPDT